MSGTSAQRMMRMSYLIVGLVALCSISLIAQPERNLGNWIGVTSSQKFSDQFKTFAQGELRTWNFGYNINELLWRGAVLYNIKPKHVVAAGYVRVDTWPFENEPYRKFWENRFYQEYLLKTMWGSISANHRFRLEQRWITIQQEGTNYSNRFRYMLNLTYNMPGESKFLMKVFNEIFLDFDRFDYWFDREAGESGLNQNRLYVGGGYKISKQSTLQLGLIWQYRPNGDFFRLVLGYSGNLDFT